MRPRRARRPRATCSPRRRAATSPSTVSSRASSPKACARRCARRRVRQNCRAPRRAVSEPRVSEPDEPPWPPPPPTPAPQDRGAEQRAGLPGRGGPMRAPSADDIDELPKRSRAGLIAALLTVLVILGLGAAAYLAAATASARWSTRCADRQSRRRRMPATSSRRSRIASASRRTDRPTPSSRPRPRRRPQRSRSASCSMKRIRPIRRASAMSARRSGAPRP